MIGPRFFVLDPNLKIKKNYENKNNLLLTCGGSDPNEYTIKFIEALEQFDLKLNINVVIGPKFSKNLIYNIKKRVKKSHHKYKLFYNSRNLSSLINFSDLAISASGLTKYELFFSKTPAIVFSNTKDDHRLNAEFIRKSKYYDLGFEFDKKLILKYFTKFYFDKNFRKNLLKNSLLELNLNGFQNLKKYII